MQVESMMSQFRNLVKQMSDDELHEAGIYLTQQLTKKEDFVEVNIFSIRNFGDLRFSISMSSRDVATGIIS